MIRITRAVKEVRERDRKRQRYLLEIGNRRLHLTSTELLYLHVETGKHFQRAAEFVIKQWRKKKGTSK